MKRCPKCKLAYWACTCEKRYIFTEEEIAFEVKLRALKGSLLSMHRFLRRDDVVVEN